MVNTTSMGPVEVACPKCDTVVEVPVNARFVPVVNPDGSIGYALVLDPDLVDLWAHVLTHGGV